MGQFLNKIRAKLGLEPRRDVTLTGKTPNEVIVSRTTQNESVDPSAAGENPVVLAPMRMSPPTPSHGIVVDKAMQLAKAHGAPHHIILTRSHDVIKKKTGSGVRNPLTPEQKLIRDFNNKDQSDKNTVEFQKKSDEQIRNSIRGQFL